MDALSAARAIVPRDGDELPPLSWRSWLVLALFIVVSVFVIRPLHIPIPLPTHIRPIRWKTVRIHMDMKLAPWTAILVLLASTAIKFRQEVVRGFVGSDGIEPYAIVILIFALAYICISLDQSGLLSYIAMHVTKRWGCNGRQLLLCFYTLSTIMAVLTSNDVVVLCLTPIICIFSDTTGIDAEPFLVAMFVAANTASMALYIGNPTNIIAAQANGISFLLYSAWMALPFLGAVMAGAVVLHFMCLRVIPREISVDMSIQPRDMLVKPRQAVFGASLLAMCLIVLSVSSFYGVAVWIVTLPFGFVMLAIDAAIDIYQTRPVAALDGSEKTSVVSEAPGVVDTEHRNTHLLLHTETQLTINVAPSTRSEHIDTRKKPKPLAKCKKGFEKIHKVGVHRLPTVTAVVQRLPYSIVPFSIGMFIMVECLSELGWTPRLAWLLKHMCPSVVPAVFIVGIVSSLTCNVLNNLPMTILFTRALKHPVFLLHVDYRTRKGALFALIVGSNLGANFTLVGSLAGLMFQGIAAQKGRHIGYFKFIRWCLPILPVQLAVCCAILAAEMVVIK
ncbi:hypothetical protein GGF37_004145 [Kickxella alabastrina]|nr:hypothetical protein GGF37_004145 [Kickxella alabastrina]